MSTFLRLQRSKNGFEMYSITLCILLTSPFILLAYLLNRKTSWEFHLLLFAPGWLLWTWVEYLVHPFLMDPENDSRVTRTSRAHQHHHKQPSELEITLLDRILLFIFNGGIITIAYRLNNYFTFFAGFSWGSAAFCYIHYLLHCKWTRRLMAGHHRFHIYHHCKYTSKCFGVSVPWWDQLFGTIPGGKKDISERIVDFYYKSPGKDITHTHTNHTACVTHHVFLSNENATINILHSKTNRHVYS